MLRWYQGLLKRRPIATQVGTTAILFGAGDAMAQHLVEQRGLQKHDFSRTGRMVLYGGAIFGPAATYWYKFLASHVNLSSKPATIVSRVALDQLVFTPFNLTFFLSSMAIMEGPAPLPGTNVRPKDSWPQAKERARQRMDKAFVTGVKNNYLVWPWVQLANFSVVPLEHRVLVVNVVALGWNCYLSYLNSGGGTDDAGGDIRNEIVEEKKQKTTT